MAKSEEQIQQEAIITIWNRYPETRNCLFHVPNGGNRTAREGAKLKGLGVIPGVPDLLFLWKSRIYPIELKTETGRLSPVQVELHQDWARQGVEVKVMRSASEVIEYIEYIISQP